MAERTRVPMEHPLTLPATELDLAVSAAQGFLTFPGRLTEKTKASMGSLMNTMFRSSFFGFCILTASALNAQARPNSVREPHAKDLVVLAGDQLVPFSSNNSARFLRTPYTVLYFGAGWCPDCRHFSPSLVAAYDRQEAGARQFEVLLISQDKTAEGMLKFMKTEHMRWPALSFEQVAQAKDLNSFFSGHGIPCLTVIDSKGAVVLQSKNDQDANDVLQELAALLKRQGTK